MSDHTPGPWKVVPGGTATSLRIHTASNSNWIGEIYNFTEGVANANLVAAAPDLLDACRRALREIEEGDTTIGLVEDLVMAIAKAEGSCK